MNLIEKFNKNYKNYKNIMKSFELVNNHIMSLPDNKIENIAEDILDFYDWFCDKLDESEELFNQFYDKYGEDGPKIFQVAEKFITILEQEELSDFYNKAPQNVIDNVDTLLQFIMKGNKEKDITISYINEDLDADFLIVPGNIDDEELLEDFKENVKYLIVKVILWNGVITVRFIGEREDIIYSFTSYENKLFTVGIKDLAEAYKNNPYSSERSELYGEANIKFK